ncbi:MAG: hypothetical protein LJF15_07915 [Acidobacteria bacterium]|jgi:hypothetical protein|nr:hypothetical protein [Acidobacteriota bacterium]
MTEKTTLSLLAMLLVLARVGPSSAQPSVEAEDAVLVAVLSQVADEMIDDTLRAEGGVACLSIDPGGARQSVPPDLLARLDPRPFLRRGAECERRPAGAVEIATDRPAVLITAGPIEWREGDDAWVTVSYFRTPLLSAQRVYRAVREESGWVCLGQVIQMSPS